jgi:hypothetical protein
MGMWRIVWFDGMSLRETVVGPTDPFNVVNYASGQGVSAWQILSITRVPQV